MSWHYERSLWRWFNKRALQWVQVVKLADVSERPWMLIRATKGRQGFREIRFSTLGDLIAGLFEHELDSLIETHDIPAMELIAMAADDGEAV